MRKTIDFPSPNFHTEIFRRTESSSSLNSQLFPISSTLPFSISQAANSFRVVVDENEIKTESDCFVVAQNALARKGKVSV